MQCKMEVSKSLHPASFSLRDMSFGLQVDYSLTTRDEVEFNVRYFVGSRCHRSGRAFLERFILIKSFLNVVCLKVDQRVVNSPTKVFRESHRTYPRETQ